MGGIGNIRGAVLGGFIIGIIQGISDNRIGNDWTPAIVFVYLIIIMRDIALIICVALVCCYAIIHPWIGVMGWTLLSIMNLHKLAWAAADLPLAAVLACSTLVGMVITRDRRQVAIAPATILLVVFMVWICITLPFSFSVDGSMDMFKKVMKIDFMILVALVLINSRTQIIALASVLVFSIGFYGLKGGIFTIVNGGNYRVWGPEGTFIEGNNELALAIIVCIPLMRFLQMQLKTRAMRWAMGTLMVLSAIAALGTQSRGALIAIVAMAAMLWWRNRNKAVFGVLITIIGIGIIAFMIICIPPRSSTTTISEDQPCIGSPLIALNTTTPA